MKGTFSMIAAALGLFALHGVAHARVTHTGPTAIQSAHGKAVVACAESGDDDGDGDSGSGSDDGQ